MTLKIGVVLSAVLLAAMPARPQTTLTGAIQFATDASGAFSENQSWNTLGGDACWNLWLAEDPDARSPLNGPSDAQASINTVLLTGHSYQFYMFGAPDLSIQMNGLNLFFDGNNSTPGISVFGKTNSTVFAPNFSSGTRTLAGGVVTGSGSASYAARGVIVVLTGYTWNAPGTPPGDVCQAFTFAPGGGASFAGSFTLQVWPAADLSVSVASGPPGTTLTFTGSGFGANETVIIYGGQLGGPPVLATATTDASGAFTVAAREPQHPLGPMDLYAEGAKSHKLGTASFSVTPALAMNPRSGSPGGNTTANLAGFGAGEIVAVYWNAPRQLLGTVTTSSSGGGVLPITIPADAPAGLDAVAGVGQTSKAIGLGEIKVQ